MITYSILQNGLPAPIELAAVLPGPNRKRAQSPYVYRLKYLNPNTAEPGCMMTWEVQGGRLVYQIAIERQANGRLHCHCTCADAIFRAEAAGRSCKHVLGFLAWAHSQEGGQPLARAG